MVFRTLGAVPKLREKIFQLGGRFLHGGSIPAREREIVILRTAGLIGCEYEFAQHSLLGLDASMSPTEIDWCLGWGEPNWSSSDLALIQLAEEIGHDGAVSEVTTEHLARSWDTEQIVELVLLAGFYRMVGAYLTTFGVELDDGIEPWTPQRSRHEELS